MTTLLVTGGCGFIGSNYVRWVLDRHPDYRIINVDKLTYAGNPANLKDLDGDERYRFVQADIGDTPRMTDLMRGVDLVAHFAAESHVDRSLAGAGEFIATNVFGTYSLLVAARENGVNRFLHVSTDEVYGPVGPENPSTEDAAFRPTSPYAASKTGGELMASSFFHSYRFPVVITRGANTIGPYQYPEKAIPLFTTNAIEGKPLPLYGDGRQVRDRLYVTDHCAAADLVLHEGEPGRAYNVWAGNDCDNRAAAEAIVDTLGASHDLITPVEDRAGHDQSYYMDGSRLRGMGWRPQYDLESSLRTTVEWYRDNRWWWEPIKSGEYQDYYEKQYGKRLAAAGKQSP
ncbi:MAG: dTDP-glucose 4,6-dehydratase [Dehalococcoidia bacterium]|nr:dTDP-glucose 4,6-dehydratase [Dehalococcoidia bacterium]